jgi:hypothetical protein
MMNYERLESRERAMVRILMVGARGCNNEVVVEALRKRGFQVEYTEDAKIPDPLKLRGIDVVYGAHLQTASRYLAAAEALRKKTIVHFVGSDAYRYANEKGFRKLFWRFVVYACELAFYTSPHLMKFVGKKGAALPFPINVDQFKKVKGSLRPERDTLYYCPGGDHSVRIYRLDWILNHAKEHPEEKITIIGNAASPADHKIDLPNVEVIPFVPQEKMPELYANHKRLIRMTSQDGLPRMLDEALLCGLEVIFNGKKITSTVPERDPEVFARRFEEELLKIL